MIQLAGNHIKIVWVCLFSNSTRVTFIETEIFVFTFCNHKEKFLDFRHKLHVFPSQSLLG